MGNNNSSFDERAKEWDTPDKIARAKELASVIVKLLPDKKPLQAMEFGCGTGLLSYEMADRFDLVTLIDTSEGMLDVLREKIVKNGTTHFKPLFADIFANPVDQRFDVIYSAMTLHHIADACKALVVLASLLHPGGLLFIADLDKEDGSFHLGKEDVHHGFDRDELSNMAQSVGFIDIKFQTAYEVVKRKNFFSTHKYPIFLMRATRP